MVLDSINSAVTCDDLDVFDSHVRQNIIDELDRSAVCLRFFWCRPDDNKGF